MRTFACIYLALCVLCKANSSCVPVSECPPVPQNFPHGEIICTNANNSGSVCEYKCTGKDYSVWPKNLKENKCLENGTWSNEQPCCARPCPPYLLYDSASIYHVTGENAQETLLNMLTRKRNGVIAEDATKISTIYFSGKPREETRILLNEYEADLDQFLKLVKERMVVVNEGGVNMGAAIQYALDNLLTDEAGMRDERVPKAISIITNRNSDDDTTAAVEEARKRGVLIYVYGFETEGYTLDRDQLLNITGEEDHIFMYDKNFEHLTEGDFDEMFEHFCRNPCDHVMHEHQ